MSPMASSQGAMVELAIHPATLFRRVDGSPSRFAMGAGPNRHWVRVGLWKAGGCLEDPKIPDDTDDRIRLAERNLIILDCATDVFDYNYVLDCIKANVVLTNLRDYRLNKESLFENYDPMDVLAGTTKWSELQRRVPLEDEDDFSDGDDIGEKKKPHSPWRKIAKGRQAYSKPEQKAILQYIVTQKKYSAIKGKHVWIGMEKDLVCQRTWQSMKENFRRQIMPQIEAFGLKPSQVARLKRAVDGDIVNDDESDSDVEPISRPQISQMPTVHLYRCKVPKTSGFPRQSTSSLDPPTPNKGSSPQANGSAGPNVQAASPSPTARSDIPEPNAEAPSPVPDPTARSDVPDPDSGADQVIEDGPPRISSPRARTAGSQPARQARDRGVFNQEEGEIHSANKSDKENNQDNNASKKISPGKRRLFSNKNPTYEEFETDLGRNARRKSLRIHLRKPDSSSSPVKKYSPKKHPSKPGNVSQLIRGDDNTADEELEPRNSTIIPPSSASSAAESELGENGPRSARARGDNLLIVRKAVPDRGTTLIQIPYTVDDRRMSKLKKTTPYCLEEDSRLLKYMAQNDLHHRRNGVRVWQVMEDKQIVPDRTWQSMKNRYTRYLAPKNPGQVLKTKPNLEGANQSEGDLQELLSRTANGRRMFTFEEDQAILDYIVSNRRFSEVGGNTLWEMMENREVVRERTRQSLKERFRKRILPNLHLFNLNDPDREVFQKMYSKRKR